QTLAQPGSAAATREYAGWEAPYRGIMAPAGLDTPPCNSRVPCCSLPWATRYLATRLPPEEAQVSASAPIKSVPRRVRVCLVVRRITEAHSPKAPVFSTHPPSTP